MRFISLQENLEKALSLINRTATVKSQLPLTTNVLVKVTKEEISITGTDLENTTKVIVPGKSEQEGGILLPTRTLIETVSSLAKEQVSFETEGLSAKVKSGKYEVKINGIAEDEFPKLPKVEEKEKKEIEEILRHMKAIVFAAAADESRAVLTGVLMIFEGSEVTLVATDGYRLSLKKLPGDKKKSGEERKIIVPARILSEVSKIVTEKNGEENKEFLVVGEGGQAMFLLQNATIFTRLLEGEFPTYQKIIPQSHNTKIIFDKDEFLKAVRLSSIFARESANIIKISIAEKSVVLSANAPQIGENRCEVEAEVTGDANEIAFNSRFLLEFLGAIDAKEITFEMTGPLNPGVFKIPGDESYLHIIMPVRVQG